MSDLPREIVFLLLIGAFWLVQFLWNQRGRPFPPPAPDEAAEPPEDEPVPPRRVPAASEVPRTAPSAQVAPMTPWVPPKRAAPAAAKSALRRYSRQALLADRRALQDGIVIAAILQPCRAHRPYDVE